MFRTVLIANRGEIACRILRTLRRLNIRAVAVYSDADRHAPHVIEADEAINIGPAPAVESYLDIDRIIEAAEKAGAEAIHPGYGFLSENVRFAEALATAGLRFIGPRPEHLRQFGLKHEARALAAQSGVPLVPGSELLETLDTALQEARQLGFPLMLKSTGGGGGIGLRRCMDEADLIQAYDSVRRLGANNFKHSGVFLERFVETARHVEVQIFGDGRGGVIALGERDCSLQRRNQKIVEEAPAPQLPDDIRSAMHAAALRLSRNVAYESAGTVEFIYDVTRRAFYFLEVNTRLQVEHGVTEALYGVDLVEWMVLQAAGKLPPLQQLQTPAKGAAIEVRLYAENPNRDFQPSAGTITEAHFPANARVDGWIAAGTDVSPYYDPMLAKIIVHGSDRADAIAGLQAALRDARVAGVETNLDYLRAIAAAPFFADGNVSTAALGHFEPETATIEVLKPGAQTSVQDFPGRLGLWSVGVPPSGPMDSLSFRLANRSVGNEEGAAGLECTVEGPTLRFHCDTVIALGGAAMMATLDGAPIEPWTPTRVRSGQTLVLGRIKSPGLRTYLAIQHGLEVPRPLGSGATFALGKFGGHATGVLALGDTLHIAAGTPRTPRTLDRALLPVLTHDWDIGVEYGPHGAPDFFTDEDIETLFNTTYEVHFNSARTGVRLIGPKPQWARKDGGEAGLHPSNIHDNAYAVGTIDFTGDMPIILGPDGPSLGGFVCPATIVSAELWKIGQLAPGDRVRFKRISHETACAAREAQDLAVSTGVPKSVARPAERPNGSLSLRRSAGDGAMNIRPAGDENLLVEFGPMSLDFKLRFRAHQLMERLAGENLSGLIDLTPGIRSLQVHFDPKALTRARLLDVITQIERELPPVSDVVVPSRIVRLPLSWNDEAIQLAVRKYHELVRPDAPWCPSNIEFIRRINGLPDEEAVRRIIFDASYLVLGLGDVYLGAPVATPVDPRHRLVTTKYNPARVWTPENAVGIGGAYLCVYGMEGPGGYQLFGRTVQMWSTFQQRGSFEPGTPWLLRLFDQIQFYPVTAQELMEAREDFRHGQFTVDISETRFSLAGNERLLATEAKSIAAFRATQRKAFQDERERWAAAGVASFVEDSAVAPNGEADAVPEGCQALTAHVPGNVWSILVEPGNAVEEGQPIVVLESMKMEIALAAPAAGILTEIRCAKGRPVRAGEVVAVIKAVSS